MKLKFKKQAFQTHAVEALADCFAGQPRNGALQYRIDPGRTVDAGGQAVAALEQAGFKNAEIAFAPAQMLQNIQTAQRRQDLPMSEALESDKVCAINLDIEMETGTGKTYCYIKSMFELHHYKGFVVADIDALSDKVSFTNGVELQSGEATKRRCGGFRSGKRSGRTSRRSKGSSDKASRSCRSSS